MMLKHFTVNRCRFSRYVVILAYLICATSMLLAEGVFPVVVVDTTNREPVPIESIVPPLNTPSDADSKTSVNLPVPQPLDAKMYSSVFQSGVTKVILAWNGKSDENGEEILVVSRTMVSTTGRNEAVIGIIPLPGKPVSVQRGTPQNFVDWKERFDRKLSEKLGTSGRVSPGPIVYPIHACYDVIVLEVSEKEKFIEVLNNIALHFFGNTSKVMVTDENVRVLTSYWDKGFRYFAFDISNVSDTPTQRQPLVFRFKSTFGYYPLAINAIGGSGYSLFDLIVITPQAINLRGAFEQGKEQAPVTVKGKTSVPFSLDEMEQFDPLIASLFDKITLEDVHVRNFLLETEAIGQYTDDFVAINAAVESLIKDDSAIPAEKDKEDVQMPAL